ncbi:MAG: hypothetical protein FRX49_05314 [Trebouxia sp. A1-2]|nr:MAG: hypothetical protein FRX49_05314 [Trebouxia sp. A1-2]
MIVTNAGGSTPAVVLPVPGLAGRGRGGLGGRGGHGGAIRTFVPQTSGAAGITPAWMTKKASAGSPSEETSSSIAANPFVDPAPTDGPAPQPTPSVFMPAAAAQNTAAGHSSFASPFASAPPASASSGMLTQLSQNSANLDSAQLAAVSAAHDSYSQLSSPAVMDADSAAPDVPADSALSTSQGAGPMMPPADSTGDAYGPKFPSRDGSDTRTGEDFFGNLSGVEGGAVDDQEASFSSPALNESTGQNASAQEEGGYDIAAMEVRASEASIKDYHGLGDWQRVMEVAQGWLDLGYPEHDVRLYLADYGIDMEVYDYWLWRYYPEWLVWWQNHGPQANQDTQDSIATAEGAATAVDSAQGAEALQSIAGISTSMAEAQPLAEDSAAELPQEAQPMDSEQQPDESETQGDYPLSFSLGGGSEAVNEFPNFGVSAHAGDLEEMEINLGGENVKSDEYIPESGAVSLEQPAEVESTAALHDSANMAAGPSQHDDSNESALMTTETSHQADESAPALAAEDSFQADGRGIIAQTVQDSPPRAQNPFGGNADEAPDTTWHNPVWDTSASPEQASRVPSPFFGVVPGVGAGQSAGEASTSQQMAAVNFDKAENQPTSPPQSAPHPPPPPAPPSPVSPLPWDLLSESSEEEVTPRQARRTVENLEEEDQDMQPEANGSAMPKAPAPEAAEATARTMSIADQIAFGKQNVASLFQEASRGLGQQLRSSFALPSSSSPPKLYQRSPHLVQIYGNESEEDEEEADEAVRPSGRETPKAARRLSMGPDTPLDESPAVTPRATQEPPSEEDMAPTQEEQSQEAEPEQPRRKKTGDEAPSRERSPEDHFAAKDQVGIDEEEPKTSTVAEDDVASDEGWEGMDDIEVPLPEEPSAAAPQAALEAEPTTAVEAQPAVASAEDQQEQSGDDTVPESPFEDDDNEGWEDMEDLTAPLEVAEAAEQAAAVEPEAADEAESHGDGSNQHQETAGSPAAPSDLAGDQAAAKGDQDVLSRDEPSLNIPFGDDAAEEGWEGLHDQDVPAAEHEDRAAHLEDQVAEPEPERRSFESQEEPSEREAHLEAQVEALSSELASKDTQLASLTHQLEERDSASAELFTENSELSSSHQHLSSELEDSRRQLSATQDELHRSTQAAESWQSQLAALQASSAAETASLRKQLTDAGAQTAEEEEKAQAAQQDADKWRRQLEAMHSSSKSAAAAAAQREEQLRQDIANAHSELEGTLESHQATLAEIQGGSASYINACMHPVWSLGEAHERLTAVTSDRNSLADKVAASSSELNSLTQQRDSAKAKSAELSEQLDSVAEQLRDSELMCSELRKEVEALKQTHAHQTTSSESRHAELSEQLEEIRGAHAKLESECELLTQQMSRNGAKASPSPAGSPQRKAQALLEELEDYRGKMGVADARIIDLEEEKAQLEEAKAAAEAASKEAFALREKQTERIKRTKAGGPGGLAVVTAEREDAMRRAEQLEFEMRELRAECKSLMDRLQSQSAADTASMQPVESELNRSQADSAPAQAPESPPHQAPASTQGDSSELSPTELTRQLEEAVLKISSLEADIVSLHAQVVTRNAEFEGSRASLSTDLALMTQQVEQLSSERDQATQRADSSFSERDSFAEKARELKAELAESTLQLESLSAEKEELKQQLEGLLAGAKQTSEAQDEVQKLQTQLSQLQEQLLQREEEVRRLEEEQGQLHQKVQSLEEEAQESFEQLTGKEEECDRLEALLETAREGKAQQASEQLKSLHADLASLRQQLMSSEEQVQVLEQDLQDRLGASEALQAAEEQLSQATQRAESLSAELGSSQVESRRLRQEFEQQITMLTQQLRDQVKETDDALQNALAADKAKDNLDMELAAVRARIQDLEVDLAAAEGARDEFVYHLSPKKPPRPAGSPAPKASADQLRAALKAAREHAAGLEASAEREMASADEAYMLLGEAHSTMALYEAVLLQNDLDPEFVRSLNAGDASFSGDDEDNAVELASVASADRDEDAVPSESGDDAGVPSELGDDGAVPGEAGDEAPDSSHRGKAEGQQDFGSPSSSHNAAQGNQDVHTGQSEDFVERSEKLSSTMRGNAEEPIEQDPGYDSPTSSGRVEHSEDPLLQPSASPVAIRFMKPASPAHQQEMSLDTWGVGQAASGTDQGVEGWEDEDDWWKQDS